MYKTLFTLSLIFQASLGFSQDNAAVRLSFFDSQKNVLEHCSGTAIKMDSQCAILTNAHCFNSNTKSVDVMDGKTRVTSTTFIVDATKDLAEIKIAENQSQLCETAFKFQSTQVNQLVDQFKNRFSQQVGNSYKSLGFIGDQLVIRYSRDSVWPVYGYSVAEKVPTSLSGIEYLVQIPFLQMNHGMSGGPVYDINGLIGIKKSFVPYQSTTQVISLANVVQFMKTNSSAKGPSGYQNNRVEDGGENSGTNGGDGGAAEVESSLSLMDKLLEPKEGIKLELEEKNLLAIGSYQIDGHDDYNLAKNKTGPMIFSGSKEFEKEKPQIFQRIFPKTAMTKKMTDSAVNLITLTGHATNIAYSTSPAFSLFTELSSDQRSSSIELHISNYSLYPNNRASLLPDYNVPAKKVSFKMQLLGNNTAIQVTENDGTKYICKNEYYFKIICAARGPTNKNLSFSRSRTQGDVLRFRYTVQANDAVILNYFGSLEPQ